MSFGDITAAIRMREVFTQIAESVVERMRPNERIGKVYSYNVQSQTAKIYFPGESTSSLATVRFALDKIPSKAMAESFAEQGYDAPADIVRIAGSPGAYYILDYVAGIPQPYAVDLATGLVNNPHSNPSFDNIATSTYGNGETQTVAARSVPSGWTYYWGTSGATYASDSTTWNGATGYSLKMNMTVDEVSQRALSSYFTAKPGSTITLRVKCKSNGPSLELGVMSGTTNTFGFFDGDPNTLWQSQGDVIPPLDNVWREYSFSCVQPPGRSKAFVNVRGHSQGAGANVGEIWFDDVQVTVDETPPPVYVKTGFIIQWPSNVLPDNGYFWCRGGTFSSIDYPVLASIVGDTFGTHSSTTYYLPDLRGRSPIGVGAVTPAQGGNNYSLGQKWGDERLQQHSHGVSDPGHMHNFSGGRAATWAAVNGVATDIWFDTYASGGRAPGNMLEMGSWWNTVDVQGTGVSIQNAGSGNAQNVHPVLGTNFIIKN